MYRAVVFLHVTAACLSMYLCKLSITFQCSHTVYVEKFAPLKCMCHILTCIKHIISWSLIFRVQNNLRNIQKRIHNKSFNVYSMYNLSTTELVCLLYLFLQCKNSDHW